MKKTLLTAVLCLFFGATAFAQKPFNIGLMVGTNISTIPTSSKAFAETNWTANFCGGAFVRVNIKKFTIQPEVLFSMKGSKLSYTPPSGGASIDGINFRTSHIDVPIIVAYNLINKDFIKFRIVAGPMASFTVAENSDLKDAIKQSGGYDVKTFDDAKNFVARTQWGFQAGLGLDIWKITLDVRYEGTFNDVRSDMARDIKNAINDQPVFNESMRNSLFRVTVGYKIF